MDNSTTLEQRVQQLENSIYHAKEILSFEEACAFLNFSKSYLYKLTSACAIPHYKPSGKMAATKPGKDKGANRNGSQCLYYEATAK